MTCKELVELITDYLEGTLPPSDRKRFREHLMVCPECRIYLVQMRRIVGALGRLTEEAIPEGTREDLLQAFRDWRRRPER
ncbi:MAG: zf-HC2 domain-containing protein [Armatimonadetes bacterium]|nr:zf-HC2 domain-containing protein [Armatimonadota bacterium]